MGGQGVVDHRDIAGGSVRDIDAIASRADGDTIGKTSNGDRGNHGEWCRRCADHRNTIAKLVDDVDARPVRRHGDC